MTESAYKWLSLPSKWWCLPSKWRSLSSKWLSLPSKWHRVCAKMTESAQKWLSLRKNDRVSAKMTESAQKWLSLPSKWLSLPSESTKSRDCFFHSIPPPMSGTLVLFSELKIFGCLSQSFPLACWSQGFGYGFMGCNGITICTRTNNLRTFLRKIPT